MARGWVKSRVHAVGLTRPQQPIARARQRRSFLLCCRCNRRTWTTRDELRIAIVTWIERTYRRRRRQLRLGRLTPVEFEVIMITPAALAA